MIALLWRMTAGYRLRPWRSPYLLWRIETYSGMHAEKIGFADFWRFTWRQRRELLRYLRWAAGMQNRSTTRSVASEKLMTRR
jgi:hypothetical protein